MSFSRYESYKESGVEWLGEVPEHWDVRAIKHIVSIPITDGPHETPNFPDEGIPFVSAEAVSTGVIDFSKIRGFISESDHFRYSQKYLPQVGDIYMVKSGATTGITAIVEVDREFNIWSPLAAIRCGKRAIPRFILNFMRSKNFQEAVTLNWSFGTQQNIGMGVIENLAVTLPPIPEQQTIAAFLDRETAKIDALIAEQQRLIELLKEKRQSVISHAVTRGLNPNAPMKDSGIEWLGDVPEHWGLPKLKHFTRFVGGGTPSRDNLEYWNGDIPWVSPKDMKVEIINSAEEYITQTGLENSSSSLRPSGQVLMVVRSGILKHTIPVAITEVPVALNQDMKALSFTDGSCLNLFFMRWTQGLNALLLLAWAKQGATVESIEHTYLTETVIPLPPITEQQAIVAFLDRETAKLDTLTAEAKTAITLLQERRTALISAAVTGKIDVRGLVSAKPEVKAETVPC
ncbi:restriction endonuclease subunit S [Nitrosomonas sp.]|uniref:restriction endonuclease subunit S n=1 Tax=Nitrosomonas sp. TaxID=42353 RepID=UPI00272F94ED|nr:restriction endonuclease subunit S [Nitrosomonas sp.]MDP1788254.1 restriction endonuclease subunit S [Nitrosomonas sp.]